MRERTGKARALCFAERRGVGGEPALDAAKRRHVAAAIAPVAERRELRGAGGLQRAGVARGDGVTMRDHRL